MSRQNIMTMLLSLAALSLLVEAARSGFANSILAIIPIIGWGWYFSLRESQEENTWFNVLFVFSTGYLAAPIFVFIGDTLNPLLATVSGNSQFIYFVLRAGVIEELAKCFALVFALRLLPEALRRPEDSLTLVAAAALGFAFHENFFHNLFLLKQSAGTGFLFFLMGALIRVPLHVLYSSIWGPAVASYAVNTTKADYKSLVVPLGAAILVHGLWDTIAQSKNALSFIALAFFFAGLWYLFIRIRAALSGVEPIPTA